MRHYDEASLYLDRALWLAPDWVEAFAKKAQTLLMRDGSLDEATAVFKHATEFFNPAEMVIEWPLLEVFFYFCDQNFDKTANSLAVDAVDMELNFIDKGRLAIWNGQIQIARNHFDAARILLETKVKAQPSSSRFHSHLAIAYAGLGRREEAIAAGKRAIDFYPFEKDKVYSVVYMETLLLVYLLLGEVEEAINLIRFLVSVPSSFSKSFMLRSRQFEILRSHPKFLDLCR
jgi:tetratricopeptide (TPR) repeat protein